MNKFQLLFMIFAVVWKGIQGCDRGLTQLRYRQSLDLMYCLLGPYGTPDPCQRLAGGHSAKCQPMENGFFVCCGTPELLYEILTGAPPILSHWQKLHNDLAKFAKLYEKMEEEKRTTPLSAFFEADDAAYEDLEYDEEVPVTLPPMKLIKSVPNVDQKAPAPKVVTRPSTPPSTLPPTESSTPPTTLASTPPPKPPKIYKPGPSRSIIVVAKSKHKSLLNKPQNSPIITANGPVLSLLGSGHFLPNFGKSITFSAPATVVHLQDGPCSIIVNTGLPSQHSELRAALQQKSISDATFNYTVITSLQPQFIGNLALFPTNSLILGAWTVDGNQISDSSIRHRHERTLCSSNTVLVSTPGPTSDSVAVIAKNVPGMGTVVIAGSLFIQDDDINRVDALFTSHVAELFESRQMLICQADWIVPAHSMPIPISRKLKEKAECGE
uniref:Peptidase A1 domain-containing protein n=1 Tax=Panagrellus redivivus TaxID=6233 RepID=A0A7E4UUF7_PANRE